MNSNSGYIILIVSKQQLYNKTLSKNDYKNRDSVPYGIERRNYAIKHREL